MIMNQLAFIFALLLNSMLLEAAPLCEPKETIPQPLDVTNCTFDATCQFKVITRNAFSTNGTCLVLDTSNGSVQWIEAGHGSVGRSALFQMHQVDDNCNQCFVLETVDGKFLGFDFETGNITIDEQGSNIKSATPFLMMEGKRSTRRARFRNHNSHIPLGQTRNLCVVSHHQSFLVTSHQGTRSVSLGNGKVCRNERQLDAETGRNANVMEFRNSLSYQFEILQAQLYVQWMSKDTADVCPGRLHCKDTHAVWNHAHVCCN